MNSLFANSVSFIQSECAIIVVFLFGALKYALKNTTVQIILVMTHSYSDSFPQGFGIDDSFAN
jgi:hypothetical protein